MESWNPCLFSYEVQEEDRLYSLPLDFEYFRNICNLKDLYENMEEHPKEALLCVGAAIHKVKSSQDDKSEFEDNVKINIRLHNHPESMISLRNLKAAYIDRLVSVRGTVVKASTVRPLVVQMTFKGAGCGANIPRLFPGGNFFPPVICDMRACKSRTFFPIRSTVQAIDFQKIRLQELQKGENHEEGRVPRTVECELTEDLVDSCIPGDIVTVTGIIRQTNNYAHIGGGKSKTKLQGIFYLYLEAVYIKNSKSLSAGEGSQYSSVDDRTTEMIGLISFSPRGLEFIVKFSKEHGSDVFRQIIQSICPSIYGHELVKAGIVLALFAGVRKHSVDQNKVPVRGDIDVIIVGDPGLGKSQLLQAAAAISPVVFMSGNATTNAGLTVAVVKDRMTNDYAFEAGAVVLADCGLCCIDEFDKMSAEHQALLEAMEQQCVSVAKAGLIASLSARTSILAAANQLVAITRCEKPQPLEKIYRHECNKRLFDFKVEVGPKKGQGFCSIAGAASSEIHCICKKLCFSKDVKTSAGILQNFYLKLRDRNTSADGTPITARQLESLVRLAEARARLDLREQITKQDALDVVEIMKESLFDKYLDEHGVVDFGRCGGMSQEKESKRLLFVLNKQSELDQKDCFSLSEISSLADKIGLRVPDIERVVDTLNTAGYLIKKGPRTYQVLSSSYSRSQTSRSRG